MQIAGKKCFVCSSYIKMHSDANGCAACGLFVHPQCQKGHDKCPSCGARLITGDELLVSPASLSPPAVFTREANPTRSSAVTSSYSGRRRVLTILAILVAPIAGYYAKGYRRRAVSWAVFVSIIVPVLACLTLMFPPLAAVLEPFRLAAVALFVITLIDALRLPALSAVLPSLRNVALAPILVIGLLCAEALTFRALAVQAFTIPSGRMMNTLLVGDYIFVNKFLYGPEIPFSKLHLPGLRALERGDIIVFRYPNDESRDFIKRIIAVGGDSVQVRDNRVWLNGKLLDEPYVRPRRSAIRPLPTAATSTGASLCTCRWAGTSSSATIATTPRTAATGAS